MKLRKIMYIATASLVAFANFSCSDIDENERLIESPLNQEEIVRNVLVEDFTGQECVNCPTAHEVIEGLHILYGSENLIAVSIHGGSLAINENDKDYGLANDIGEEYNKYWEVKEWPKGMVDRSPLLAHTAWTAKILDDYVKYTPVDIEVSTSYTENDRNLKIDVKTTSEQAVSGKLQVWLTEDNIEALQWMPNGKRNYEYIHNNVLRAAVNGAWGTDYSVSRNGTTQDSFNFTIREDWVADNMAVVAFVYNNDGVVQVVRQPLKR